MPPKKDAAVDKKKKKKRMEEVIVPKDLASQFPPDHLQMAIKMFHASDKKGEGAIDVKELGYMLRFIGGNPTDAEIEEWTEAVRMEGNTMNILGFLQCAALELRSHKTDADLFVAFSIFDNKNTGFVTEETLKKHLAQTGEVLSPEIVQEFLGEAAPVTDPENGVKYADLITKINAETQKIWNKKAKKLDILPDPNDKKGKKGKKKKK